MRSAIHNSKQPQGQLLVLILLVIGITIAIAGAMLGIVTSTSKSTSLFATDQYTLQIAEAGMDKAIWCLNHPSICGPTFSGETVSISGGEYISTITSIASNLRQVDVTAYYPSQASPVRTRSIRATVGIDATTISFNYGVQVNVGGLFMDNNTQIVGNVYSNGTITGLNSSDITGDVFVATGMSADDEWTLQNDDQVLGQRSGSCDSSVIDVAQSFEPLSSGPLSMVSLYIKKIGSPSNINLRITTDNSGQPGTELSSGVLAANLVTTNYGWVNIAFASPATLTAGTTYWLVLDADCNNSKYWIWGKDKNQGFGNGFALESDDWSAGTPSWNSLTGDMNFKLFTGGNATQIDSINVGGDAHANTINNSSVSGDAYYQTIISSTVTGTEYPGSEDPAVQPFPVSDGNIAEWEQDALAGGVLVGNQTIAANQNLGPIKIEGDLTINNNAIVTIQGPVWVEGDILFDNNSIIRLDPNFGTSGSVIIADDPLNQSTKGRITLQNGTNIQGSGDSSSYIMILSTHNNTSTTAINVTNNTDGAIFYAHSGIVELSNNVDLKEVTGYKIIMQENATITYESGLANSSFTSGPGGSWAILEKTLRDI